jgi:hypothetical protein
MKSKVLGLLALWPLSLSLAATAATITYSNEATFLSETGSALLTLPDAAGPNGPATVTIAGELTLDNFSAGGFIAGPTIAGYWNLAPNYLVKNGTEEFDLIPLKAIYAIGFTLYEPTSAAQLNGCNKLATGGCTDSAFQIELFSGATSLGSYSVQPPNVAFNFYGYWTSDPISKVTIRETRGTDDNEFFGRFMTATTSNVAEPPPVPLPAAAWLLLSGLGGLGFLGRRRKAARASAANASRSPSS